jgi:hypothetical protein
MKGAAIIWYFDQDTVLKLCVYIDTQASAHVLELGFQSKTELMHWLDDWMVWIWTSIVLVP